MIIFLALSSLVAAVSIDEYGAIPNDSSLEAAWTNQKAFQDAIEAAIQSSTDRVVTIPNADNQYYMMPVAADGVKDLTIWIDAEVVYPDDRSAFPSDDGSHYNPLMHFTNCENLKFTGSGTGVIEGQGYWWWVNEFLGLNQYTRPYMLLIEVCKNILFEKITLRNSPRFHFKLSDVDTVEVRNMEIFSDWYGSRTKSTPFRLPIFPLNTDGIDPAGKNIHIHDIKIQNYDDAVVAKPSHGGATYATCTQNMLVENVEVTYGVGMSIGSVPPKDTVNCVRNIIFRNIQFKYPFKAIYIKTNPGDSGSGIIENVLYQNIKIDTPIWWGTYIGPQQQEQPDGSGPGCMFYPLIKECATQPRVTIKDITLQNIQTTNAILSPGILRCNAENPCTNFVFQNVSVDGWLKNEGYICENVQGVFTNANPAPSCETVVNEVIE